MRAADGETAHVKDRANYERGPFSNKQVDKNRGR
jgi:hypothetical protein